MQDYLWVEKYRPKKVSDTILPEKLRQTFQTFVDNKNIPNLILSGGPGCGKTTVARAMLEELDCNYMVINGSLNGNIDTLRNDIYQFASSVSFKGGRKYVILDEADYLTPNTQAALRNFTEEYSKNCGFIFTCNFKNKIIEPLHSRASMVDFKFTKDEKLEIIKQMYKRFATILKQENVTFDKTALAELIKKHFPDFRRMLNELQRYASTGAIDSGILVSFETEQFKVLLTHLKEKDFTGTRKWVAENSDVNDEEVYAKFYDVANDVFLTKSIPQLVLILAKYSYQSAFVSNRDINLAACLVEIMAECEFK